MQIVNQKALDERFAEVARIVPEKVRAEIKSWMLATADVNLYLINPYRLAAERSLDRTAALKHADRCPACSTEFDAGFDRSIEVSFATNPAIIRPAEEDEFSRIMATFEFEPGISIDLDPGESHFLRVELREGNYFLLEAEEKKVFNVVVAAAKAAGSQKLTLQKLTLTWADSMPPLAIEMASAAVVSSLQEFRDLFSSEMLSLDETFSIENLGFLFTDIKGSTELYERLGDALRAAVEMIEAFDNLETARKLKNSIVVKVGIHHGPCIAVTLNERLDYFGTTVNIAARVQGLSDGSNIMASGAIFGASDAEERVRGRGWMHESFVTSLKGLKASYEVHKLFRVESPGARP
jgi:adenylate cyclase